MIYLGPDCRGGKCAACSGQAWDEENDELTDCTCKCHFKVKS